MAKPALVVLGRLAAAGGQPALLLADQRLEEMTGVEFLRRARELHRRPAACSSAPLLETSLPGVFAAGDVRHGSVTRVASAVGEGAIAVQLVHQYLAAAAPAAAPARRE